MSKFLGKIGVVIALLVLLVLYCTRAYALSGEAIVKEVNNAREAADLQVLSQSDQLESSAKLKLQDMQEYHYWAHSNPITKEAWWHAIWASGFRGKVGENLARGYTTEQGVIRGWLHSPSHRQNLLNKDFSQYGIAVGQVSYDNVQRDVVVFHFGN